MFETLFVGLDNLCDYIGGQPGFAHRLAFRELDPAAPAAWNAEAERLTRGELEKVVVDWRSKSEHLATRWRQLGMLDGANEQIAFAEGKVKELQAEIEGQLAKGRNPSEAEGRLAEVRGRLVILQDRKATLERVSAARLQDAYRDLRDALTSRQGELLASLTSEHQEGVAKLERAVGDTLPAVLVAREAEAQTALGFGRMTVRRAARKDATFERGIKRARLEGKLALLKRIRAASESMWQAAAWLLERKWPQEFARRHPDAYAAEQFVSFAVALSDIARRFVPPDQHGHYNAAVEALLGQMEGQARGRGGRRR